MPESVFGLPMHPLIVHATVMVIPAAAALLVLSALLPGFRHWARFLTPLTAITALVLVPITTSAGEALKEQVGDSPAIEKHAELASYILPWVVGLTVVTTALYAVEWRNRRFGQEARASRPVATRSVLWPAPSRRAQRKARARRSNRRLPSGFFCRTVPVALSAQAFPLEADRPRPG